MRMLEEFVTLALTFLFQSFPGFRLTSVHKALTLPVL
jgi:hypothetical protein